ncbi:Ovule protein [Pseudomonas sp. IT-P291]
MKKSVRPNSRVIDWLKRLFAHCYVKSESETSAASKDFNLGRILFCCANHGRLFSIESARSGRSSLSLARLRLRKWIY